MQNRTSTTPQSKLTYDEKQDIQGLYVKEFERESPFLKGRQDNAAVIQFLFSFSDSKKKYLI